MLTGEETERRMRRERCPVCSFDRAEEGYSERVLEWLSNPHAHFRAFGPEAREFQRRHRSERLRTMTFVAPAEELARFRPVCVCVDGSAEPADSWSAVFSLVTARLLAAQPRTFAALQEADELAWLGCPADDAPVSEVLAAGALKPEFGSWEEVVRRVQWLFLMCGIRLNEAIVQVDPYDDDAWRVRLAEIRRKRAEERAFLEARRSVRDSEPPPNGASMNMV